MARPAFGIRHQLWALFGLFLLTGATVLAIDEIAPEDWVKGTDTQLAKAVEVVAGDVAVWKKARTPGGTASSKSEPVTTVPVPKAVSPSVPTPVVAPMPTPKTVPPTPASKPAAVIPPAVD